MIAWLNQKRNILFHALYGSAGAVALLLDQVKLVDMTTLFGPRTAVIVTIISIVSIVLHFTDERVSRDHS